jgi:hypothetical protein
MTKGFSNRNPSAMNRGDELGWIKRALADINPKG